jgi:hypothetical protein
MRLSSAPTPISYQARRRGRRTGASSNPEAAKAKITLDRQIVAIATVENATGR